jgi:hypothetical protein
MEKPYERRWDNATESDVSGALAAMESGGNKAAALALAQFFYERLDGGGGELDGEREIAAKAFSPLLHKYMHLVLQRIVVDGWTPEQAMGFRFQRGKPKGNNLCRDVEIAMFVRDARAQDGALSLEGATLEACEKLEVSERTVTRAWSKYGEYLPPKASKDT